LPKRFIVAREARGSALSDSDVNRACRGGDPQPLAGGVPSATLKIGARTFSATRQANDRAT